MPRKNCDQRQRHLYSRRISGQHRRRNPRLGDRRLLIETLESRLALSGDPLSAAQRQELINGLGYLGTWTGDLSETAQLGLPLAISGLSIGQSANVEQMIQTGIVSQLSATSQSAVNTDQFVDALRGLSRTTGDLTIAVNPASVTGDRVTGPGRDELRFTADFVIQRQASPSLAVNFGSNVEQAGLKIENALPLSVTSQLQFSLAFGLNLLPGLSSDQAFFIRPNNFSLGTSIDGTNVSGSSKIGLLASQLTGGTIDLDARVQVQLTNIDLDPHGNITAAELKQNPLAVMAFQQTTQSSLSGALPVTAILGSQNFNAATLGSTPTLQLASVNVFAGAELISATPNDSFRELQNFRHLPAAGLITALTRTGRALEDLAPELDVNPDFGGFGYTRVHTSDVVDLQLTMARLARNLYDPLIQGADPISLGTGFALANDAVFTIHINDDEQVNVTVPRTSQGPGEPIASFVQRFLPQSIRSRITAGIVTNAAGENFFTFRAIDPEITKFEILFANNSNSIKTNLGISPGSVSLQDYKFNSLQSFSTLLAQNTGVANVQPSYDTVTNQLAFRARAVGAPQSTTVPLQFDAGLGPLSITTPASATFTVTPTFDGRVAIDLDQLQSVLTATGDAPANGQLSGPATFRVSIDGSPHVNVSVPRDTANTSIDDLVADINAAIAQTSLKGKLSAGRSGARLTLISGTGTGLLVDAMAGNPAATELKLIGAGLLTNWDRALSLANGAQLQLNSSVATNTLTGPAALGILPVDITTGTMTISANANSSLNRELALFEIKNPQPGDVQLPAPVTSLAGNFVTIAAASLGATPANPGVFTLTLATPNQWATRLVGLGDLPSNGRLTTPASMLIKWGEGDTVPVTVAADSTNQNVDDLIADINAALSTTRLDGNVVAQRDGNRLALVTSGFYALSVEADVGNSADTVLRLRGASAPRAITHALNTVFEQRLAPIADFRLEDFIGTVQGILDLFEQNHLRSLTSDLPLIDQSLDDILGVSQRIRSAIVELEARAGLALKLATQAIVENLSDAIAALPDAVLSSNATDLIDVYQRLRIASLNAERNDLPAPVNLASVIIASIAPYNAAIAKVNAPGIDMVPLNNVRDQLTGATPSLIQLASTFAAAMGVGTVTGSFTNARLDGFEQAMLVGMTWSDPLARAVPLTNIDLPDNLGLGSLRFGENTTLTLSATRDFRFDFGFNFTTDTPFLRDTSRFNSTATMTVSGPVYAANVGGVAVNLGHSSEPASILLRTTANATPARFNITLNTTPNTNDIGNIPMASAASSLNYSAVSAKLDATLPVYITGNDRGNITATWTVPTTSPPADPVVTVPPDLIPTLESSPYDFSLLTEGIELFNERLKELVRNEILDRFPLIAPGVNVDAGFMNVLSTQFYSAVVNAISANGAVDSIQLRNSLFTNIQTALNSILVASSLQVTSTGSPEIRFRIRGSDMYQSQFDADLLGLNFNVANGGQVNIQFAYDMLLGFGLSLTQGFYFIVQRLPEEPEGPQFKLDIAAQLALGSTMQTQLMALPVSATPKANASGQSETRAAGRVNATFIDVDNRLSIDQVDSSLFADELNIVLGTGGATSTISLTVASNALDAITGDPDLPDFTTDLLVVQTFSAGDELNEPGAIPQVRFNNIGITLGDSIARMIQPIVEQADEFLEPIRPVLESLNEEVPVLSDLRRMIGEEPLTWIEALEYFLGESDTAETVREVVEIVAEIDSLISQLRAFDSDARLVFGSYVFNSNFDLRIERPNGIDPFTAGVFIPDPLFSSTSDGTVSPAVGNADPAARNLMDDDLNSIGFRFPIFENPQNIVSLLFGRDITFITWDIPPFDVALETPDLYLATIPIPTPIGPIPLSIYASINFEFSANIGMGFDSRGMREGQDFLDGLYFRDRGESGPPVFALGPGVTLTAAIGIPAIVEAGVEGQLSADLQARWNNIDRNGRYHLDELLENFANGPNCVMNLSGALVVGVNLFFTLFGARTDIPILPDTTLVDFGIYSCNVPRDPELAEIATIIPATLDFEGLPLQPGTLVLNIGPYAERRNPGISEDDDERIEVSQVSPGVYRVRGFGETRIYGTAQNPVLRIYGDAGEGTNFVEIDNSVTVPVTLVGGDGDDTLRGGSGPNRIVGRGGRDLLYGGVANDIIIAGGSDGINEAVIFGGPGDDNITAINGYNNIDGEGGSDFLQGGTGIDLIYGGRGNDQIFGGGGADQLFGEQDNDIVWGQGDEGVTIHGGRGDNSLYGSNGPDLIYASVPDALPGESGRNLVMARDGDDVVYGGIDNTTEIHGGADNDRLYGGEVGDLIFAGSGIDTVYGYGGDDIIYADSGNNTIFGGIGNDLIFGSSGLTARPANWPVSPPNFVNTYAGSGVDMIYGEAGNDTIYGGVATGTIDGGANADFIYGGTGGQTLQGAGGDDLIRTGDGNQTISGGAGNDLLEQSLSGVHTLTDGTLLGRGLQVYQLIERIRLINPSMTTPAVFDVSNFRGVATVVGNAAGDAVRAIVDADVDLVDGNLKTSQGTSVRLENVTRALVTGIGLDNTFNVSLWTGEAVLTGGLGNDRVVSARDTSHVLNDGQLIRGSGGNITLSGIRFATLAGGASNNILDATSFTGSAWLYGGAGDDTLRGGAGDDYLDGGAGFDGFFGNGGNDVLVATSSSGSTFAGGQGDDVFYGSVGLDLGSGDAGQDRIYGRGGNDVLGGGAGDDILDGGEGNDTLSGDAGSDVLVGAGGHDTLYAFNLAGSGDDAAINYLYGDYGTGGSEPGTGNDMLRAGLGNDLSFGEAGVNTFSGGGTGAVSNDGLAPGLRPSSPPAEPPIPQPPAWPPQLPGQSTTFIIDGITSSGRWTELNGSGSASGISRSPAEASAPAVAVSAAGPWVTWIDERSGSPQVYAALHTIAGWSEYASSARGGGISLQSGIPNSRAEEPSIAIDAIGLPIIAWTQVIGNSRDIMVARYDAIANGGAGAWVPLGGSLSSGGISGTGLADNAQVVMTSSGPVVAWLENIGGIKNVYAKRFQNGNWVALGTGGASGTGISNSATTVPQFALAAQGANVSVAWTQSIGTRTQIYLRSLINNTWSANGSSASGNGISQSTGSALTPALVYFGNGEMIAAWQDTSSSRNEIYAARFDGSQWTDAGLGSRTGGGVSNTQGNAIAPKLAATGEDVSLVWQDNRRTAGKGNSTALYTKRWQGSQFIEELIGDARDRGLSTIVGSPRTHAVAVDAAGHPFVVWSDTVSGKSEIYLQVNKLDLGTVHYVNDSDITVDSLAANSFSTAVGSDNNDGLTPATPKRTLQSVLNDPLRPLNVGDVILLDAGTYVGTAITGASPTGVIIIGSSDEPSVIQTPLAISNVDRLTVSRLQTTAGVTVTTSTKVTLQENDLRNAGIAVSGGNSIQVVNNQFLNSSTGVMLSGDTTAAVVASNTIRDGSRGIWLTTGATAQAATGLVVRDNRMLSTDVGVAVEASTQGRISQNWIDDANTGMRLTSTFAGLITNNIISDASTGVLYQAANTLDGNLIYGGTVGIATNINSNSTGLGYFGLAAPNRIVNNATGIALSNNALVQQQYVWGNTTGIAGTGSLVPTAFAFANMIGGSNLGVDVSGTVQYTRLHRNTTGVAARNGQLIAHNELVNNTRGIDISADQNVRVFSNTLVGTSGTNVRVVNAASQIEVRNNILVTDSGYNLYVDNSSTAGFFSDYNNLTAGPAGKLVYWTTDFTDILDWQEDVYQFDLNSSGTTAIDQRSAVPRFVSRSLNDYRVFDLTARLRFTSPTIDVGDARVVGASAPGLVNLLANPSFEQGLSAWTATPATSNIGTSNPSAYDGSSYFRGGTGATVLLEQTVDLVSAGYLPVNIDGLQYTATFGARVRSALEAVADRGTLTVTFLDAASNTIGLPVVVAATNVSDRWELIGEQTYLPALTRSIRFQYTGTRLTGTSNDIYLDGALLALMPRSKGVDVGALGNAATDVDSAAHIHLITPDLYKDWERNKAIDIRWQSFGNTAGSGVAIKLLQDTASGPQLVTSITTSTVDDGQFTWIAANSGVNFGTAGLRVEVSLVANPTILDRSTESFTVPENTNTYFVNDRAASGDEYTSSLGSNRNTGKVATAPKPYPNNILRIYTLGAGDTLSVDTGEYPLLSPLVISNLGTLASSTLGDDEGFLMRGAASRDSQLSHANPLTVAPVLTLVDADLMTVNNLQLVGGTMGLSVRDGSTNFNADRVRSIGATQRGMLIDSGSSAGALSRLLIDGSLGPGLKVEVPLGSLTDSVIRNNAGTGLELIDVGPAVIEANRIFNNVGTFATGVQITQSFTASPMFGSPNLEAGRGNVVHSNSRGVKVQGAVSVVGNTIYNHVGTNSYGIESNGNSTLSRNVIYGNTNGIVSNGASTIQENRLYSHSGTAIVAVGGSPIQRNVVYSNSIGIRANTGTIANNVLYANADASVALSPANNLTLVNNTIVQTTGDGVRVNAFSSNVSLRNNNIWAQGGFAVNVASESQTGFQSDTNNLFATGTGSIARWQNVTRTTLADWRSATFQDFNSLNVDPNFVSLLGSDGVLGFVNNVNDGRDDDLHLRSQYGTFQGVALAPVATASGTGVPAWLVSPGNPVLFTTTSKLIDRGALTDNFAAEPLPNGGAINIGAYGGTSQASISPAEYVTITNPDGAEVWPQGQTFSIRWRNQQPGPSPVTFTLELLKGGVSVQTITSSAPDTGSFTWTVPLGTTVGDDYRIRVTRNDNPAIQDVSDNNFSIRLPISVYYVNDGTVAAGDFTTTPGNDASSGLSPDAPKGSISAVLAAYSLKPGDTILVDAGTYTLSTALILGATASGITIRGFHDPADPTRVTVLDRANTQFNAIELINADDVTLDRLTIRNANYGVFANATSDSDRLTISNSVLGINSTNAIFLDSGNDWTSLQSNRITHRGAWLRGTDATVNANTFVGVTGGSGLQISGLRSQVTNNSFSGINGQGLLIMTSGASNSNRIDVRENTFIDLGVGIQTSDNALIRNNSFTRASTAIFSAGEVRNNVIREGVNGIVALSTTSMIDNRILLVSGSGITLGAASTTRGNYLYNNATGISATGFTGVIANNFLVNNTTAGIAIASGSPTLINNTIVQATGDAIRVTNVGTQNVNVRNNILQVSSGYALNVDSAASPGFQSDYNVIHRLGTGRISRWQDSDYNSPADWYYEVGLDKNSIFGDPLFVDLDGPDNQLGFVNGSGDFGLDDNFTVVATSPAIDGGNPNDLFFREPLSGGSRINIGAGGNTPIAEASPLQRVQVLSPGGLEKFEHGQTTNIQVRSHGLLSSQPTLLLNMGTNVVGPWAAGSAFQTSGIPSGFFGNEFTNAVIDRSGVVDPIPEELYRTYLSSDTGTAATLRLQLPVPDGTYSLRMHFIEGIVTATGARRFDIKVNGTTLRAGYDIFASAGARFRAVAESFTGVSAVGGSGLTIELTTLTPTLPALLAALEVFTATPLGTPTSSISLQVSGDGGNQWSPIPGAQAIPLDRWGNASFLWTIPSDLPEGDNYRIRARSNAVAGGIIDESDSSFRITHAGTQYYVNDNSLAGDVLTTAIGNNSASGKSPDQPMASLAALLTSYNLGPGDVIYIDSGTHRLNRTLTLNSSFSGVSFEGPSSGTAVLDRNNLLQNMFVLENADDLGFQRLTFRNAQYSFFSNDTSDSDRLSIADSSFINHQTGSIFLGQGSDFTSLQNNNFNLATPTTVTLGGADSVVTGNQFSNSTGATLALQVRGARTQVTNNTLSNVRTGISVQPNYFDSPANRIVVSGNTISDASVQAINVNALHTLVENNLVVRAAMGISGSAQIRNNILRGGTTGMSVFNSLVENNRIFNHSGTGLFAGAGTVTRNNRIYNNNVGVETQFGFGGTLSHNYLVNNTTAGFLLSGAGHSGGVPTFSQNTVIQGTGDAFRVTDFRTINVLIENNVIQVGQGYAYNVDASNTRGFVTNYNLIHRTGTGKIARWEATDFNDAADWYYEVGMDQHSVFADPLFVDLDGPDNQLGFVAQSNTDFGADDNFSVQAFSPAMDRGNPNTAYALEPLPNGGRINLGGSAGSILAETSAPQMVQVLSPQGLEKFERGQSVPIAINTNGLRNIQPTLLINGGSLAAGRWQPASRVTTTGFAGPTNTSLSTATIDRSGVVDPPPEEVYRTYTTTDLNPGVRVAMTLPLADGNYSVRLHFIEHEMTTVGARRFDIRINGATVRNSYDIFQAAGSVRFRATAETFTNIVTTGGAGLTLELVNVSGIPATIAAIEVVQASPLGIAAPTVALDFSSNGGESWTPIPGAQAVPVDRWGNASFNWTVPNDAPQSNGYRVRARALGASGAISSTSPQSFSVANSGLAYFLSPTGDNRNYGKSVDQPMRSLSALVAAYDLDAGDVVQLIGGNYRTYRNIQLGHEDSGVTFQASLDSPATITRGNTNDSMRVIEFTGADGVTINGLRLTGGENGIFAANGSSTTNTITNSHLYANLDAGLRVGAGNVGWTITSSRFYGLPGGQTADDQAYGILFDAAGISASTGYQILGNEIYDHAAVGISQPPAGSLIERNAIYGNQQGITATSESYAMPLVIRQNSVRNNSQWGISVNSSGIEVTDNDVFGHSGPGDRGIIANGGSVITNNRIYDNHIGADAFSGTGPNPTRLSGNRIYGNSLAGVAPNAFANIDGNYIYSNSIGVQTGNQFFGNLSNNVIYANTNRGVSIQNPFTGSGTARYINNTIYQAVGDGIRLEGGARNNQMFNNIVWVLSGNAVSVANDSQVGFESDYNLLTVSDSPNANIGMWNGVARKTLADWQAASARDAGSLTGAPNFVDIDGADNVLGYVTTAGGKVHGGGDDNFYVTRNSPAIDRGHTWQGVPTDAEGLPRSDDPGTVNSGTLRYIQSSPSAVFSLTGTAQNWRADNTFWTLNLPFAFPMFGITYNSLWVTPNGLLHLGPFDFNNMGDPTNTTAELAQFVRIAALWDDLRTDGAADDNIFVDNSVSGATTIRWNATNKADNSDVNFSVTLHASGEIRFNYGPGNSNLTPTVGISRGNNRDIHLAAGFDGVANLAGPRAIGFQLVPGITDIGAYEFRGNSSDVQAPTLTASNPAAIHNSGVTTLSLNSLQLSFSEEVNPIDARSPAAYELRSAGVNNLFGDADDVLYPLRPAYAPGQNNVQLVIGALDGGTGTSTLPLGTYRITVFGGIGTSLFDLAGNRLDGDGNGLPGGNYVKEFRVIQNAAPQLFGANPLPAILSNISSVSNVGLTVAQLINNQVVDSDGPAQGIAIVSAGASSGAWEFALDGTTFQSVASALTGGRVLLLAADANTRLRFAPTSNTTSLISDLVFRAWDRADELAEGSQVLLDQLSANSISVATANASIQVTRVNSAPTDILLSQQSINENRAAGSQVGLLTAVDVDPLDQHTFQLISGTGSDDNAAFEIVGNSLRLKGTANFETKSQYLIRIRAVDAENAATEKSFAIAVTDLPELGGDVVFGDGTAQRSMVRQMVANFDGVVAIQPGAFTLVKLGSSGGPVSLAISQTLNGQGQTVVTITFTSMTNGASGALSDGYYMLTIDGTRISRNGQTLDANLDGVGGDTYIRGSQEADNFFALYGDTNGDGLVGVAEFGQFRSSFGKSSSDPGYNAYFDFELDGSVGVSDFGQFRSRFGKPKRAFGT